MQTDSAEVHHLRDWSARPLKQPGTCRCGRDTILTIGQRLEGRSIVMAAALCMDCGDDATGTFDVATTLDLAMNEHGWSRAAGLRLHDLAVHRAADIDLDTVPLWIKRTVRLSLAEAA